MDILGNEALLADVLKIAAGRGEEMEDQIFSAINEIADRIDWDSFAKPPKRRGLFGFGG